MELIGRGRCAEIWAISDDLVAKTYEPTFTTERVDRFAVVNRAIGVAGVRAPRVHGRGTHNGREVLVLDRVNGVTLWDAIDRQPHLAEDFGSALADLHLQVHQVNVPGLDHKLDELEDRVRRPNADPQILERAVRAVEHGRSLPTVLVHGDLHPANVMVLEESGELISIDWDGAMSGPAGYDVARTAYLVSSWTLAPGSPEIPESTRRKVAASFIERYGEAADLAVASVDDWRLPAALARYGEVATESPMLDAQLAALLD